MPILVRLSDGAWPRTVDHLREQFPSTSFPDDLSGIDLAQFDHAIPRASPAPIAGSGQEVVQDVPVWRDGEWHEVWILRAVAPQPDWTGWTTWMNLQPAFQPAMESARASSNPPGEPVTSSLPALILEARNGNYQPLQAAWPLFAAASGLSSEASASIAAEAAARHLPDEFVQIFQPSN